MKKQYIIFLTLLSSAVLAGCAEEPSAVTQTQFSPAAQVIEKPIVIAPPTQKMQYALMAGNDPGLTQAYKTYIKTGKAENVVTTGFEQFAYSTAEQPVIGASPFELTVISLEPGETVTNVSSGDPLHWSYSLAYSGGGKNKQAQVLIKPSQFDMSTDLVITTDRRLYTLKIVSRRTSNYVRNVSFWYPEEVQNYWAAYDAKATSELGAGQKETVATGPDVSVDKLNFNYQILTAGWSGAPNWKPTRVFDDGRHTYIQFPAGIASTDMPVLFVMNNGNQEMVNYRSSPPYFVVDKIFKEAVLVTGVGGKQTKVTINNHSYA
ncbi:MAG: P-type conjugative transfer protein TrbG [Gammaproteobacteria bacterium]